MSDAYGNVCGGSFEVVYLIFAVIYFIKGNKTLWKIVKSLYRNSSSFSLKDIVISIILFVSTMSIILSFVWAFLVYRHIIQPIGLFWLFVEAFLNFIPAPLTFITLRVVKYFGIDEK